MSGKFCGFRLVHGCFHFAFLPCSAGVYVRKKRSHDGKYSFKDYLKQSSQVADTAEELAMDDCYVDKTMKISVRNALLASLEGDKDDTLKKVF